MQLCVWSCYSHVCSVYAMTQVSLSRCLSVPQVIDFDDGSGSVLRIQPLRTHRDEAIYECTATNSAGEINTSAKLTVLEGRKCFILPQRHLVYSHYSGCGRGCGYVNHLTVAFLIREDNLIL